MSIFIANNNIYIVTIYDDLLKITENSEEILFNNVKQMEGTTRNGTTYLGILNLDGNYKIFMYIDGILKLYKEYDLVYREINNLFIMDDNCMYYRDYISSIGLSTDNDIICQIESLNTQNKPHNVIIKNFCDIKKIQNNHNNIFILDKCGILYIWNVDDDDIKIVEYYKPIKDFMIIRVEYIVTIDFDGQTSIRDIRDIFNLKYNGQDYGITIKDFDKFIKVPVNNTLCLCITKDKYLVCVMDYVPTNTNNPIKINKNIFDGYLDNHNNLIFVDSNNQCYYFDATCFSFNNTSEFLSDNLVKITDNVKIETIKSNVKNARSKF